MSDGENFSRGPSFVFKNHESVSYTISTWGGGSGRGNMENRNIEVTYDALRKRIAELEAALQKIADRTRNAHPMSYVGDYFRIATLALEGKKT